MAEAHFVQTLIFSSVKNGTITHIYTLVIQMIMRCACDHFSIKTFIFKIIGRQHMTIYIGIVNRIEIKGQFATTQCQVSFSILHFEGLAWFANGLSFIIYYYYYYYFEIKRNTYKSNMLLMILSIRINIKIKICCSFEFCFVIFILCCFGEGISMFDFGFWMWILINMFSLIRYLWF